MISMGFSDVGMNDVCATMPLENTPNLEHSVMPLNRDEKSNSLEPEKCHKCNHPGCGATFLRPSRLARHLRQHTGERPFNCDYDGCDKAYTNKSHLVRHSQTHSLVKQSFQCSKCSLILSNRQNLKRHYDRVHTENNRFFCKECGLNFLKEQKYKEHEASHSGVALYNCKVCFKEYVALKTLKKHEMTHESKKQYSCPASGCSEVFEKWSLLCTHKKNLHTSEYKCNDCKKVFLNKAQLKSHSVLHIDDRMVVPCPYDKCPRFYFFQRNLNHHIRTNHLGKKYHCDICDTRFSSKQKITEHMTKIHLSKKKKRKKATGKSERKKRKDAGVAKKSMLAKLTGLDLPHGIEKELLNRKTRIQVTEEDSVRHQEKQIETVRVIGETVQMSTNECKMVTINGIPQNASIETEGKNETRRERPDTVHKDQLESSKRTSKQVDCDSGT
ncbi:zinc finger protein 436-like isoform X1 [Neodiprion virginianus]|uniref:zinc finger protein 436-like isoform X1 n=2 Tax=Neodiprion virginianus TaxID=2961670 RepID=UPI001EE70191|nr:zinc finger protein 436-like isoform X1 [Neodiprion virginianus]